MEKNSQERHEENDFGSSKANSFCVKKMLPIITAMEFLEKEAKKDGDEQISMLLTSSFHMVRVAYDLILLKQCLHNPSDIH